MVAVGGEDFTAAQRRTGGGTLTLFGGQRVFLFCLRLLQLCLVETTDLRHVGLVRHFGCEKRVGGRGGVGGVKNTPEHTSLTFSVRHMDKVAGCVMSHMISAAVT